MKILYHHRIRSLDGQFVHIEELVRELRDLGHDVLLVGPASVESGEFGSQSSSLATMRKIVPRIFYELIEFCYCFYDFMRLYLAARRFDPEVIYERYNLYTPSGVWTARTIGVPLMLEVNAPLAEERSAYGGLALDRLAKWSQRYTWRGADSVIAVTEVLKNIIADYGVDRETIHVMSNGVDPKKFQFDDTQRGSIRRRLGVENKFLIGFVGFVREWHRLDRVVRILAEDQFYNSCLMIVGDGPAREQLVDLAKTLGIGDRVVFTGVVARSEMPMYISAFDIALQANVVTYASPLKLLEYLSMGRAVIAPDSANIRELLTDGENALLFDSEDEQDLRKCLELLHNDGKLRARLEASARESIVAQQRTWHRNAVLVENQMKHLITTRCVSDTGK